MILVPVSIGELVDKLTILDIKQEKIVDLTKIEKVKKEYFELKKIYDKSYDEEYKQLKEINLKLWEIEDNIRIKEKNKEFDEEFITLARSVYKTNDQRFNIKNKINIKSNSDINEVKSYEKY